MSDRPRQIVGIVLIHLGRKCSGVSRDSGVGRYQLGYQRATHSVTCISYVSGLSRIQCDQRRITCSSRANQAQRDRRDYCFIVFHILLFCFSCFFFFVLDPALIAEPVVATLSQASQSNYPKTGHLYSLLGREPKTFKRSSKPTNNFTAQIRPITEMKSAINKPHASSPRWDISVHI